MITRRRLLLGSGAAAGTLAATGLLLRASGESAAEEFEIVRSQDEWRDLLTPEQYHILREEGTEPPGTSPLLHEHRDGVFRCAGCDLPLYSSEHKYDSKTGWPSFWQAIDEDAVRTKSDYKLIFMPRTEVHCRRCGGHLGHIFDDGPPPTGKRHCINGLALTFAPEEEEDDEDMEIEEDTAATET